MSDPNSVVQVRRDGLVVQSFPNDGYEPAENLAFKWVADHTPNSVAHAMKYEGYSIVTVFTDGTEHVESYPD